MEHQLAQRVEELEAKVPQTRATLTASTFFIHQFCFPQERYIRCRFFFPSLIRTLKTITAGCSKDGFSARPNVSYVFLPRRGRRWSHSGCEARKWTPCWQTETGSWLKRRLISSTCRQRCQENRASRLRHPRCVWALELHSVAQRRS